MFLHEKNPRLGRISLKNLSWNNNTVTEMEDTIDIRDFFFFFFESQVWKTWWSSGWHTGFLPPKPPEVIDMLLLLVIPICYCAKKF